MDQSKQCSKCSQSLPLTSFHKDAKGKHGRSSRCKECAIANSRRWYQENHTAASERLAIYRKENAAARCEYSKAWYEANRQHKLNYDRARYAENREHVAELSRAWRLNNVEKRRDAHRRRRAQKMQNGVFYILPKELVRLYNSPCFYCGSTEDITMDHVIPFERKGQHSIGNIVPACRRCNCSKQDKLIVEWKLRGGL